MARLLQVLWTGADGSDWDITDWRSTVQLVSLDGLGLPSFNQQFALSGARDGRRYEGTTFNQATLTLTVSVGDLDPVPGRRRRRNGDEWRELDRAWRKSVSPTQTGVLSIITGAGTRRIRLRLDQPTVMPPGQDPGLLGEARYSHILTADEQPWWEGDPIPAEFSQGAAPQPFFGGSDGSVLLYISESNQLASATLANPGDREAYPLWWARGPFTSAVLGIGDQVVTIPFSRAAGEYVYVNSAEETITDANGVSLWPLMGFTDPTFAPIPPGESIALVTSLNDPDATSAVGVSITPLYEGPW
jgi:hypothetical protein